MMLNMNQKEMLILLVTLIVIETADANWWHWTATTTGKTSFLYIPLLGLYLSNISSDMRSRQPK